MRFARDGAIIQALAALDQAWWRAQSGPVEPGTALRAVLAFLYCEGRGDPAPYREFHDALRDPHPDAHSSSVGNVMRGNALRSAWNAILADIDIQHGFDLSDVLADIRDHTFSRQEAAICNRYKMEADPEAMRERYGVHGDGGRLPATEIFPKRPAWVIRHRFGEAGKSENELIAMSWGVIRVLPGKRVATIEKPVTNVRNLESPFWRGTLAKTSQRCLVPFTSFSEYGSKRGADSKLPLHWFDVPSQPISSFAGIWRTNPDRGMEFAFLTCEPNSLVAPIHPKAMPVILHPQDEEKWLSAPWPAVEELVAPFPAQLMKLD